MEEKLLYTHYQLLHFQNLPFSVGKSLVLGVIKNIQVYAAEFRTLSVYLQRGNGRILINRDIQYGEEPQTDLIDNM